MEALDVGGGQPAISVVVPVFNNADHVAACLDSILSQSLTSLEVLCVDDGSTDGSADVVAAVANRDPRVRRLRNPHNLGPGLARNRGIDAARGDFIQMVDGDDLLPRAALETLHTCAVRDDVPLVKGSVATFPNDDQDRQQVVSQLPARRRFVPLSEQRLWVPWWHTSYLMSRALLHEHGLRYPDLRHGEDPTFLAAVLVAARSMSAVDSVVYLYRKYAKQTGSRGRTFANMVDYLKHAAMSKVTLSAHDPSCWRKGYGRHLLAYVRRHLAESRLSASEQAYAEAEIGHIFDDVDSEAAD